MVCRPLLVRVSQVHLGNRSELFGADDEIRTRDIDLGKVALYQLSYIRVGEAIVPDWVLQGTTLPGAGEDGPGGQSSTLWAVVMARSGSQ